MRHIKTRWAIGLVAIVIVAIALGLVMKKNQEIIKLKKPEAKSAVVQVVRVQKGLLPITQHYMGKVEPVQVANIASRITANIVAVSKREGNQVVKGEVLLLLDDLALASRTRAMEADLRAAESQVSAAQSSYQAMQASFERDENLYNNKAISLESFERSRVAADNALSQVKVAQERVRLAQENFSAAQAELGYAHLAAPFDGIIVKRSAEPGEIAVPGKTLLRLQGEDAGYRIIAQIPQEQLERIVVGTKVVIVDELTRLEASVSKVYPSLEANHLAIVEVFLNKLPIGLPTGATVGLDFIINQADGFIIPVSALLKTSERAFVVVVKDGIAEQVPVTVKGQTDRLAVVSGILENTVVAVGPQSVLLRLMNGVKVKPVEVAGDNL